MQDEGSDGPVCSEAGNQWGRAAGEERGDGRLGAGLSTVLERTCVLFTSKGVDGPRGVVLGWSNVQGQKVCFTLKPPGLLQLVRMFQNWAKLGHQPWCWGKRCREATLAQPWLCCPCHGVRVGLHHIPCEDGASHVGRRRPWLCGWHRLGHFVTSFAFWRHGLEICQTELGAAGPPGVRPEASCAVSSTSTCVWRLTPVKCQAARQGW